MAGESPPSTTLSPDEAADLCSHWFSEPVHVTPLYGEFDQNVRVETASNERFVLKIRYLYFTCATLDRRVRGG